MAGLSGRDIVCVGFAEWDTELWTNQHHLMSRLAATNRVLFVESLGLRRPQLTAGRDLRRIAKRVRSGLRRPRMSPEGVAVVSPLVLPFHGNALGRRVNAQILPRLVGRAARGMRRPILWSYVPQAEVLLERLDPGLVVYHCVDDIAVQDGVDFAGFRAAEARFAARADLVLCSAPALAQRLRTHSDNVLLVPNVADTAAFAQAMLPGDVDPALARLPAPRIVFTGAIAAKKLDLALIVDVARARPDWSFALVGPVGLGDPGTDVSALAEVANVHLLGARRHEELPAVLRSADVGLIPYRRNELTASVFPMKVYEYLAAGLPVVATPLPAISGVEGITVAADAATMVAALERVLEEDGPTQRAARSAAAAAHSWEARLEEIAAAVRSIEAPR